MKTNQPLEPAMCMIFGRAGDVTRQEHVTALLHFFQDRSMPADFLVNTVAVVDLYDEKFYLGFQEGAEWSEFSGHDEKNEERCHEQ